MNIPASNIKIAHIWKLLQVNLHKALAFQKVQGLWKQDLSYVIAEEPGFCIS